MYKGEPSMHVSVGTHRCQKRASDFSERGVMGGYGLLDVVLGNKVRLFVRTVRSLNHQVISPAPTQ